MSYSALFFDDYSEGAHPNILEALHSTNLQQTRGYGNDPFTQEATELIRAKIHQREASIHFVSTGTQANMISIASMLQPYESVIAVEEGHIAVHETGAIEATGHKVHTIPSLHGKIRPETIEALLLEHNDEHMVRPRLVYISQATELGTIYQKKELEAIYQTCRNNNLYLFIDGARMGSAITSKEADLDLEEIAKYCDFFYIGGTKNGAFLGEALVILHPDLKRNFRYHMKQRGALMAKTRIISIGFIELFKGNLYFENARHANAMAEKLAEGIQTQGYSLAHPAVTNQIFPILPKKLILHLEKKYGFYRWPTIVAREDAMIRLVTSWSTQEDMVNAFLDDISALRNL